MLERLEEAVQEETLTDAMAALMAADIMMEVAIQDAKDRLMTAGEDDFYEVLEESMEECSVRIAEIRDEAMADIAKTARRRDIMLVSAALAKEI